MSSAFWRGRRVLVTGHTGFKGSWLSLWLHRLGADVSLTPALQPSAKPRFVPASINLTWLSFRNASMLPSVEPLSTTTVSTGGTDCARSDCSVSSTYGSPL